MHCSILFYLYFKLMNTHYLTQEKELITLYVLPQPIPLPPLQTHHYPKLCVYHALYIFLGMLEYVFSFNLIKKTV